jgi:hypothetical protein
MILGGTLSEKLKATIYPKSFRPKWSFCKNQSQVRHAGLAAAVRNPGEGRHAGLGGGN